jgi:predicted nucleotidyltransferase
MSEPKKSLEQLIASLQERAKELNCLYLIDDILKDLDEPLDSIFSRIIQAIPPGWQYPDVCQAKISYRDREYRSPHFKESPWVQSAEIIVDKTPVGAISIYYTEEMPTEDSGPFLKEETKLINTIAERIGDRIQHRLIKQVARELEITSRDAGDKDEEEWPVILKMLKLTDHNLHLNIARKMLNHLCWSGIPEAEHYMQSLSIHTDSGTGEESDDWNRPRQKLGADADIDVSAMAFKIASDHLGDNEILELIKRWIQEDKLGFLVQVVNRNLSLAEVADAIRRYHHLALNETEVYSPNRVGIHVSLIRRFLSSQLSFVGIAKDYIEVNDFFHLLERMIFTTESHGKLGGKSAGLYLATQILKKKAAESEILAGVRIPKTWHITSDVLLHFMHHNNFDDVVEQKYKGIGRARIEYPHIIQSFKSAAFPDDIVKGLSMALDDFGEHPLIVRSSSLLEDRAGSSFSGKYKSLFLANQGDKQKRLEALMDAIAEVYASTFGPDPIEYRTERGLIDFGEEMGIMIQEVVGTKVGEYFLPSFAGVAFSKNEFRWSPTIKREDGLIRLVPGLGTRAVDRLSDDYPVMFAPGQPGLRVNVSPDEVVKYSPKRIDVINLKKNCFETISLSDFVKEVKHQLPKIKQIVSILKDGHLQQPVGLSMDFDNDELVATFEGLMSSASFVTQTRAILETLEQTLGYPVDIEFASDGEELYLLQCRPQSYAEESTASPIPKDLSEKEVLFSAKRYVSNGRVPDITHIVYVDPRGYAGLEDNTQMANVGRAVGKLNKLLPKKQFILMGPGRWGSRGDIRLGVNVTYADISNTAMLIEMAFRKGDYSPDLSFGTHFFQDLVEANIRYLPLYPDDNETAFNARFYERAKNVLPDILPEYKSLADVVKVIDVPRNSGDRVLRVLLNADLDEGVGYLATPRSKTEPVSVIEGHDRHKGNYWHWRLQMAKHIAGMIDPERFGVVDFYVFGSTKNATAGPGSDIDLLIHFRGSPEQRENLNHWLEGWSLSLAELNYLRTGYKSDGLLDVHIITDKDIEEKTSYAIKIGAPTDAARPLALGGENSDSD